MPSFLTHYTFAKEVVKDCKEGLEQLIFIGTQGPDFFFSLDADGISLEKTEEQKAVSKFGADLHDKDIAHIYPYFVQYAIDHPEEKEVVLTYLDGLLMHYCLDSSAHPYIISIAGWVIPETAPNIYYGGHGVIETFIDMIVSKEHKTWKHKLTRYLKIDNKEHLKIISKAYDYVNSMTLKNPYIKEDTYSRCVKSVYDLENRCQYPRLKTEREVNKYWNTKRGIVILHYPVFIKKFYKNLDFLNKSHSPWKDLLTGEERRESFYDLFSLAKEKYQVTHELVKNATSKEEFEEKLAAFTKGINHAGWLETDPARVITSSPIWPDGYDPFGNIIKDVDNNELYRR